MAQHQEVFWQADAGRQDISLCFQVQRNPCFHLCQFLLGIKVGRCMMKFDENPVFLNIRFIISNIFIELKNNGRKVRIMVTSYFYESGFSIRTNILRKLPKGSKAFWWQQDTQFRIILPDWEMPSCRIFCSMPGSAPNGRIWTSRRKNAKSCSKRSIPPSRKQSSWEVVMMRSIISATRVAIFV